MTQKSDEEGVELVFEVVEYGAGWTGGNCARVNVDGREGWEPG